MELFIKYMTIVFLMQMFLHSNEVASGQSINPRLKVRHGCKIKDAFAMDNDMAQSLIQCVADTTFETPSAYREYEQANGWTCASIIRYPVFYAMKSTYGEKYEMNYLEASYRCAELGTPLAERSDMETAQSIGLSYCNCGWISDWINVLVLEYFDESCRSYHHDGPIVCGHQYADAWCKMQLSNMQPR